MAQLLHLRLVELRAQFAAARRHPQLRAVAWAALRLRMREWLRLRGRPPLNVAQLRAKWLALRREVLAGGRAAAVARPSYWRVLKAAADADTDAFQADDDAPVGEAETRAATRSGPDPRRQRTAKEQPEASKTRRVRWTRPMEAALLRLRLEADTRGAFREGRSPGQLRAAWLELRERLAARLGGPSPDVLQLKNKLGALRREFAAVLERRRTGGRRSRGLESGRPPPEVPPLWPEKVALFGRGEASGLTGEADDDQQSEAVDKSPPASPPPLPEEAALLSPRPRRMKWDADATRTLLLLRGREMRAAFSGERGPARLKALWETLLGRFERALGVSVDVGQLKNRFSALRREHAAVSERRRRAAAGEEVELPPYWDALECSFGVEEHGEAEAVRRPPASQNPRRQSRGSDSDDASGAVDGQQDAIQRLEELLRRQAERQEAMRALLERQAREFDAVASQTAAANREVLEFIRSVRNAATEATRRPS